jgi:hypothetical protein
MPESKRIEVEADRNANVTIARNASFEHDIELRGVPVHIHAAPLAAATRDVATAISFEDSTDG